MLTTKQRYLQLEASVFKNLVLQPGWMEKVVASNKHLADLIDFEAKLLSKLTDKSFEKLIGYHCSIDKENYVMIGDSILYSFKEFKFLTVYPADDHTNDLVVRSCDSGFITRTLNINYACEIDVTSEIEKSFKILELHQATNIQLLSRIWWL